MPAISIVMPTFNQAQFIQDAINSILNQTFMDFELIVVNDGSTDDTEKVVLSFLDPRIKYFKKENGGTGSALNEGFRQATGKYETWLSSDNMLYRTAFQEMFDCLEARPDIDYVYGNCEIGVMDSTGLVEDFRKNLKDEISQEWDPNALFQHYFLGIVWLWRRGLREQAGEFQLEPCEDYDMVLRMVEAGGRFYFLDRCLGWFRRHSGNISAKIARGDRHFYPSMVIQKARQRRAERENLTH